MGKRKPSTEASDKKRINHPLRYIVVALCIAFFVAVNMVIIFSLSEESREASGDRSAGVTDFVIRFLYPDLNDLSYQEQVEAIENAHHIVRKAAHFLEYALLGFLTSGLLLFLRRYLMKRLLFWKTWFYPAEFCFLYAVSDEVHQIFSERGPSAKDVLIDTAGALCGILLIQLIALLIRRLRKGGTQDGQTGEPSEAASKVESEAVSAAETATLTDGNISAEVEAECEEPDTASDSMSAREAESCGPRGTA